MHRPPILEARYATFPAARFRNRQLTECIVLKGRIRSFPPGLTQTSGAVHAFFSRQDENVVPCELGAAYASLFALD